ncbi:MAG: cbb3-type cytochrome oxidase assembly protein CcoS [Lacibacter sp.]
MSVIIILLIASVSVAALFLGAFLWSVKSGQYDDQQSPPMRILFDDNFSKENRSNQPSENQKSKL